MRVKLFANLAETAGERELTVEVSSDQTLAELLEELFNEHPALREEILDDAVLQDHITILVNGEKIPHTESGLEAVVSSDDEIAIFPPVSGG